MAGARGRSAGYSMHSAPYTHSSSSSSSSSFYNYSTEFAKKSFSQLDFQKLKKRSGDGPDMELRLLVRGRNAGAIIGKSGSNIKRIKQMFGVNLFLTDSQSPERILSVIGYFGSICEAVLDLIPLIDNNVPSEVSDDVDVRILMHTSFTGYVIGRKGHGIHDLETKCSTKIQVYHDCCPRSTDRVVQINGRPVDIVNCIAAIVDMVIVHPPVGLILPYNPNNFIEIKALDYGGFTSYNVTVPFQGETVKYCLNSSQSNSSQDRMSCAAPSEPVAHQATGLDDRHGLTPPGHQHPDMPSSSLGHGTFSHLGNPSSSHLSCAKPWETAGGRVVSGEAHSPWTQSSFNQSRSWSTETDPSVDPHRWDHAQNFSVQNPMNRSSFFQDQEYNEATSSTPVIHEGQGHYNDTVHGHQMGHISTKELLDDPHLSHARRARPLDECPGLGFFPVDTRTVQVSIPKALQTVVMGRRGAAIRDIRLESRAKIVIEVPPAGANERYLTLIGTSEQLQKAQYLLQSRYLDGKQSFAEDPEGFMNRGLRKRRLPDAPWMTEDIMKMKLMRRKLERVWRAAKTDEAKKAFKDYSNEMNKVIRKVKEEFYAIHGGAPENKKKRNVDKEGNRIVGDKNKEGNDQEASDECQSSEEECFEECDHAVKAEKEEDLECGS